MPRIAGTLRDGRLVAFPEQNPIITFRLNKPALTQGGAILSTKAVEVVPDSNGDWSVTLAATENLATGGVWYTIEVSWLDSAKNFVRFDFPEWKLFVPIKGGDFADLLEKPANPGFVWVGLTGPEHPTPGTHWLHQSPDGTAGTGNLYEWSM